MQSCTRQISAMVPVDVTRLGQASISAKLPEFPEQSDKKIAVIGGGPAGISVAWQLRRLGHRVSVYDVAKTLGGKITRTIPQSRIPAEVVTQEIQRVKEVIPHVHWKQPLGKADVERLKGEFDFVVIATGAQKARTLPVPGNERAHLALDFLTRAKSEKAVIGQRIVIIGAGNVGCDVAIEADRLGAREITLLDVQEPASFGKERAAAEAVGAKFRWPVFAREISDTAVILTSGEAIPADTVVISIGDVPDLEYIPESVATRDGFVEVNSQFMTSDPKIYALGDVVKPGLLTDAIGAGRTVAEAIDNLLKDGEAAIIQRRPMLSRDRISLEYFDPRVTEYADLDHCGSQCASCGACRDCGICVAVCPRLAISRKALEGDQYEYAVDEKLCIGCGFCAGACPCGVWDLVENDPIE
jgi:NADPH-dependent glutamate synthase beta subunit-like oxidoreductase/ferredoxin